MLFECKRILRGTVKYSRTASDFQYMTTLAGGFLVINYHDAGRKDFKK